MAHTRIQILPSDGDFRFLRRSTPVVATQMAPPQDVAHFPPLCPVRALPASHMPRPYSKAVSKGPYYVSVLDRLPLELRELIWEFRMRADRAFDVPYHFEGCVWRAKGSCGMDEGGVCEGWEAYAVRYLVGVGSEFLGVSAGKRVWWAVGTIVNLWQGGLALRFAARNERYATFP
jgi:hypothetical protein